MHFWKVIFSTYWLISTVKYFRSHNMVYLCWKARYVPTIFAVWIDVCCSESMEWMNGLWHCDGTTLQGNADPLNSAFHLTYNMVLNLLRVEEINPEYMLERSFYQFQNYASIPALVESMLIHFNYYLRQRVAYRMAFLYLLSFPYWW